MNLLLKVIYTSKIGSITQWRCHFIITGDDVDHAMQDKVHFVANGSTTDDEFTRKKDVKGEASENGRDEDLISVSKEGNDLHQITTVVIHNIL